MTVTTFPATIWDTIIPKAARFDPDRLNADKT